ncbi:MAG: hypothetical protein OQK98_10975 [Gammaproteobacteria bacterium]|nr:hypothetical protein [Gammaproteobacteria bacterium]
MVRQNCDTYFESLIRGFSEISYKKPVSGYVAASNHYSGDTYNLSCETDFQGAMIRLGMYCGKYPENTIYMALASLSAKYYRKREKIK